MIIMKFRFQIGNRLRAHLIILDKTRKETKKGTN